jgi:exodeoxyribonuclease V alpha subunit
VGILAGVPVGSCLDLSGNWVRDTRFGEQFRVQHYRIVTPNTLQGLERYLGSGLIKGIGPHYASRIVARFGLATLEVLEHEPERLHEVEGLGTKRAETIKQAWQQQRQIHQIMIFLQGHGISAAYAVKIYKAYGEKAVAVVEQNPYRLAEEIWGIGFKIADRIAASGGIVGNDPRRARAGLLFLLNGASEEGHCFLPQKELLSRGKELLDIEEDMLAAQLPGLVADARIVVSGEKVYLTTLLHAERNTAKSIKRLLSSSAKGIALKELDREFVKAEQRMGLSFAPEQRDAIKAALQSKVTLLTGGPGTGKSTILRVLADILQLHGFSLLLAAPTGRAAKRLAEATGREAKTIHRLLGFDPGSFGFRYNRENRLQTDFVVIDEVSMMDIVLANSLFKAIPDHASVVLVGDADQLPSVGPGNVFRDLLESGRMPTRCLKQIYRQGEGSLISINARRINEGEGLELLPDYKGDKDFYCIYRQSPEEIEAEIVSLMRGRLTRRYGFDPVRDIQVLTPMRRGLIGTDHLNARLQTVLLGQRAESSSSFKAGDKVMQVKNNYEKEIFNGDIGVVQSVDEENSLIRVSFDGRQISYEMRDLQELILAYAITIHKSQGSEFPCVILPLHTNHYPLLQRNLLYTGVTRGKKLVVLVGSKKAIAIAIKNSNVDARFTGLDSWL